MPSIFTHEGREVRRRQKEADQQAKLSQQQQRGTGIAQRKGSLNTTNAHAQSVGRKPSKGSLSNANSAPQYGHPQQNSWNGYPAPQNMGPPPSGWGYPQQWTPNGYAQQPGPNMGPGPQYYSNGQQPYPAHQGGAPWAGPPQQQFYGQGYPLQGYPPFQPNQPTPGPGRRASGGLSGNGSRRASQQSFSKRAAGSGQITFGAIVEQMQYCIEAKRLDPVFYKDDSVLARAKELMTQGAPQKIQNKWMLSDDEAAEMGILGLWDLWILGDDSGSMIDKKNPDREPALKQYVTQFAEAGTLFDDDGINVDFFHSAGAEGVKNEAKVAEIFSKKRNRSGTPIGFSLDTKILSKIRAKVTSKKLKKPVLIIIITDGAPFEDGPDRIRHGKTAEDYIQKVISDMVLFLKQNGYPAGAVNYMFAQVGNDIVARKFLDRMDNAPGIKEVVDATSSFKMESTQVDNLTETGYLLKLLLGAISPKRDAADDKSDKSRRGSRASSKSKI